MPGRRPKPTRLKILEGNRAKVGRAKLERAEEPRPTLGIPQPPTWLDTEARAMWDRLTPGLDRLGLLTVIDGAALEGACSAYSVAVECRKVLQRDGLVMEVGDQGYRQQRPEVAIELKSWAQFRAFCVEFGLTPAARSRLAVSGERKRESDPIADAIFGT